jgi:hypothetical protein
MMFGRTGILGFVLQRLEIVFLLIASARLDLPCQRQKIVRDCICNNNLLGHHGTAGGIGYSDWGTLTLMRMCYKEMTRQGNDKVRPLRFGVAH